MPLSPQALLDLLTGWWTAVQPEHDEARVQIPRNEPLEDVEPTPVPREAIRCSTWAGAATMASPSTIRRDVALARKLGLTRLDVIINDHSKSKKPRDYDTYPRTKIVALLKAAADAGLETHVTSWVMPHESYLRRMGLELNEIADAAPVTSFVLDAEEPWTLAASPLPWTRAADLVVEVMGERRWGVTGIGYTSATKLGPLVKRGAFMVPQCYATRDTTLRPAQVAPVLCKRWRAIFGERPLVVGLAAYNQNGIAGHTVESAIRAAFQGAQTQNPMAITWWSMSAIRNSSAVQKAIASVTALVNVEHGPVA